MLLEIGIRALISPIFRFLPLYSKNVVSEQAVGHGLRSAVVKAPHPAVRARCPGLAPRLLPVLLPAERGKEPRNSSSVWGEDSAGGAMLFPCKVLILMPIRGLKM